MGLDVYVGPLCRYYTGNWKLIAQQWAEAQGVPFSVHRSRPEPPPDAVTNAAEAQPLILAWRTGLQQAAGDDLPPLEWDESPEADYFTDKPDWDGYWALRLVAGTVEFPDVPAPAAVGKLPAKSPLLDRLEKVYFGRRRGGLLGRFRRGRDAAASHEPRYPHLHVPEIWLPVQFADPFLADDPAEAPIMFGSLPRLVAELEEVNERTLQLDEAALEAVMEEGAPEIGGPLEPVARFGLAIFLKAARHGVRHSHAMKLDF